MTRILNLGIIIGFLMACSEEPPEANVAVEQGSPSSLDVCRCLDEPGSSPYMKQNGPACDRLISATLKVSDWTKEPLNDASFAAKWKKLEKQCGSKTTECLEREKKARGCTADTIKHPEWDIQNCAVALAEAIKACE